MQRIDLNSDVGESFGTWSLGNDAAVFEHVTSANVACGFHAGDPSMMRLTCRAAVEKEVVVGAHPSYRDLVGFGRRFMDVAPLELTDDVIAQISVLDGIARVEGTRVRYVKPHGALYNALVHHEGQARAVVDAVRSFDPTLPLVVPPRSMIRELAERAGLRTVVEAFADREYLGDGSLMPRGEVGAVVHDLARVVARALEIVQTGQVRAVDGALLRLDAETICIHGDTEGAVDLARAVRSALEHAGVETRSFVDP